MTDHTDKEQHMLLMGVHDFGDPAYTVVEMKVTTFLPETTLVEMGHRMCIYLLACLKHKTEIQELLSRLDLAATQGDSAEANHKEDLHDQTEPRTHGVSGR